MFSVMKSMFWDKKTSLFSFIISITGVLEMYLLLYPSIQKESAQLAKLMETYPDSFFKAFGMDRADLTFERVEPFLSSEIFSFFWPIFAVILMTSLANYAIVNEVGKGTIELTLSQPISRVKLFVSRYLVGATYMFLFSFFSAFAIVPLAALSNIDYRLGNFVKIGVVGFLFGMAVFSMAMFFSALFSEKGKSSFATGGVIILMYALNVISALKESLDDLKFFSFFHYFAPGTVLGKGEYIQYTFPVLIIFSIVMTLAALLVFKRRDLAT